MKILMCTLGVCTCTVCVCVCPAPQRPADVCTRLGLCTSSKAALPHISKTQNSEECTVCKLIVTFLDKELASNSTESEAKAAFKLVCNYLGGLGGTVSLALFECCSENIIVF